ncbi:Nn.00g096450.m01.CDS01 [Neocucurbitaria sp. VM-36]
MSLYSPLQHKRDIRLLRIQPASRISTLSVTFEVYSLDSDVQFTAVSYVWGSPTPPSWIKCNGHDVSITGNLWDVLSQLQDKSHDGLVWADAICINQSDNEEKGVQVSMMRDIYKRAANVILWLGKEEQHDRHAIRLMELFCGKHGYVANLEPRREWTLGELSLPSIDCGWMGWASLLSRPWFGRIWVVQEFLNATQSIFMSGSLGIPTALLIRCAEATATCAHIGAVVISSTANHVNMRPILLRSFAICAHQTASSIAINDVRIFDLWTRSQLLEASDPRDRVFGLLSTQTAVGMNIVDYSKTVETVYMDIARIALTMPVPATDYHRTSPCALPPGPWGSAPQRVSRFLACRTQTSHSSGLPSWVPDWRPAGFTFVPLTRYYPGSAYFTHAYQHATIFGKVL